LTPREIAERTSSSLVVLVNFDAAGRAASFGSGFVVAPSVVLTNYHVIRGASRIGVMIDREPVYADAILGYSPEQDVAALHAPLPQTVAALTLADSSLVRVGDHVITMGAPQGYERTLGDGLVSGIRVLGSVRRFQITAPISHGSSGGPVLNDYGQVVGLAVSLSEKGELLNFAVPTSEAVAALSNVRLLSFSDLLRETLVEQPVSSTAFTVPPGRVVPYAINVPQQGGTLSGSYTVSGGVGNDVIVSIVGPDQKLVVQPSLVKLLGTVNLRFAGGRYLLVFDNRRSLVSAKSISPSLTLQYYR
jgi:S1-C subfamily serine protease